MNFRFGRSGRKHRLVTFEQQWQVAVTVYLTKEHIENIVPRFSQPVFGYPMPQSAAPNSQAYAAEWLEAAADQAVAACGGDARSAVKALIVALEFAEAEVSSGYVRGYKHGRFKTYTG